MIRRAVAQDAAAITHVHRSSRYESGFPREIDTAVWQERLAGDAVTVVWEVSGAVVGFASVAGDELMALYVLPGAQRGRVGTGLLDFAVGHGARRLEVYEANAGARAFYERHGWRLTGPSVEYPDEGVVYEL